MDSLWDKVPDWLQPWLTLGLLVLGALTLHQLIVLTLRQIGKRAHWLPNQSLATRLGQPSRWLMLGIAVASAEPAFALSRRAARIWEQVAALILPGLLGWVVIGMMGVVFDMLELSTDITAADNLRARRRRTRAGILHRIVVVFIGIATFCVMLMSIPAVRTIGVTLIASAGLAGLAVGAAAQPLLKNIIAGVQMAFTEPIRLDDVVIVEGEWGRIEEIRLTFVVVKLWDERRLVVPVSQFLEKPFQNWTRLTSQLLGTVSLHLDPTADVDRLRPVLERLLKANDRWDGRVALLQVVEASPQAIEVRALMSAADASRMFDLRCDVREGLMAFVRDEMPEAMVRQRGALAISRADRPIR